MPIARILFRIFLSTPAVLAVACTAKEGIRLVDEAVYKSDPACWTNPDGEFRSFLILAQQPGAKIPYFVSGKCLVTKGFPNTKISTFELINAVQVRDPGPIFEANLDGTSVRDNITSDLPAPSEGDPVYVIRAKLKKSSTIPNAWDIETVYTIENTGRNFGYLLNSGAEERRNLFNTAVPK